MCVCVCVCVCVPVTVQSGLNQRMQVEEAPPPLLFVLLEEALKERLLK